MARSIPLLMIAGLLMVAGCSASQSTHMSSDAAKLVVYAKSIPLYPGAKFDDAMGSDSYGDDVDSHSEGMCLWFKVKDYDKDKVMAWYEEHLPAAKHAPNESGTVVFTTAPQNGEPGETMGVYIDDDGFRVWEETKPGKHKKA